MRRGTPPAFSQAVIERGAVRDLWTCVDGEAWRNDEVVGYEVEASDGDVGVVEVARYDDGRSYLVVALDPWMPGRAVVVPAGIIERIDPRTRRIELSRTRDEVVSAPELDSESGFDDIRRRIGSHYGAPI